MSEHRLLRLLGENIQGGHEVNLQVEESPTEIPMICFLRGQPRKLSGLRALNSLAAMASAAAAPADSRRGGTY